MRAGLSTIQQTLTPEAATVLNHSIAEAGRRNHGQTTPLHVAATLLAAPSGFLRQACIRSHPNSSHPLQCRALELCFSVALDRLPTSQNFSPGLEPPISNALMAALKRAQAHQRRGCPEQQQQPLLAVKVELEQLIISILDDPSVSRVMREARFSSPAVKATIEQSLNSQQSSLNSNSNSIHNNHPSIGLGFRPPHMAAAPITPSRNLYLNPRLQQQGNATQSVQQRSEETKKVIDILSRIKKRNPVLVGDSEPDAVVKEVLKRIENKEIEEGTLKKNIEVIHLQKELSHDRTQIPSKIKELGGLIESRLTSSTNCDGVILDLGDLKWLVEQPVGLGISGSAGGAPQQQVVSEMGRAAVVEMGKLLTKFCEGITLRVWLIGTATCETYLRCQVYHPTMENDWDLQAVPITARAPLPGMFPRLGTTGILNGPAESLTPLESFQSPITALPRRLLSENSNPAQRIGCCPQCMESCEQELAKLVGRESEKSSSEAKSEAARPALPQWLQNAKTHNNDLKTTDQLQTKDQELIVKHQTQELQKKWNNTCLNLHPNFHRSLVSDRIAPTALSMTGLYSQNLLGRQTFQPKLQLTRNLGETLQLNPNLVAVQSRERAERAVSPPSNPNLVAVQSHEQAERAVSPPGSPVRTDLALGQTKNTENTPENTHNECIKDFMGCIPSEPQNGAHDLQNIKLMTSLEADFADSFKKLLKGLNERVWWQQEAASAVATTVTQCKLGNGKRRGAGSKGDTWLLFTGPDRVGKKKMAFVLSEQLGGDYPIMISLGSRRNYEQANMNIRGKTVLDQIAEAVRRNPFSVIMLEDIDEANMLIRGSIKRAMERGRLADSHGREISLGNVIFILTANWLPDNLKSLSTNLSLDEEKLATLASGGWQLRLAISEKTGKRRANWLQDEDRSTKPRKDNSTLSFDLNEAADAADDKADGSRNSSDLTTDHEDNLHGLINRSSPTTSASRELLNSVDESIVFKPVDPDPIRIKYASYISTTFSTIIDDKLSIEVQDEALEKILGGVWLGRVRLEEWTEKYLVPSFRQLKTRLPSFNAIASDETMVVRLELDVNSGERNLGDWLPSKINLVVD